MTETEYFERIIYPSYTEYLRDYFIDLFDSPTDLHFNNSTNVYFNTPYDYCSLVFSSSRNEAVEFIHIGFLDHEFEHYRNSFIPKDLHIRSCHVDIKHLKDTVTNLPLCFKERYEFVYCSANVHRYTDEINKKMFFKDLIHFLGLSNSYIAFNNVKKEKIANRLMGEVVF